MDDRQKAALEKAMKDFDQKRSAATKRQEATEAKQAEFSHALERCFEKAIRPEMEDTREPAGGLLRRCGHFQTGSASYYPIEEARTTTMAKRRKSTSLRRASVHSLAQAADAG